MSYRNPGQIQADQSGQIYGQAMANLGQSFLSFAQGIAAQRKEAAEEQKAENDRLQKIGYEIEEAFYDTANTNYEALKEQSPGLSEQFKTVTAQLLDGVGTEGEEGYQMGAIEAQTKLRTQSNLSKEDRKKYRDIVQKAKAFQTRVIAGGGEIMADLEDLEKVKPQDIGNTHFFIGNTKIERRTSQYSAAVLANKPVPGAQTSKTLKSDENGMPIVSVNTVFDAESAEGKKLLEEFPDLESQIKDGKISFTWERSIDKLGDGFIGEIPKGSDPTQLFVDTGAADDNGNLTPPMNIGVPQSKRVASDAAGIDNLITTQYINTPGLEQDSGFQAQINATVQGLISHDPGYLQGYMQNTLKMGPNYDYKGFMKLSADEKTAILTQKETEKAIGTKLSKFKKRKATPEDVAYINENARRLDGEGNIAPIKKGDLIYYTEKVDQVKKYKPDGDSSQKSQPTVITKDRWESFKDSGYSRGNYIYEWNENKGVFEQKILSTIDGRQSASPTGETAKTPQELGNLSGGQNWANYEGFELPESTNSTSSTDPNLYDLPMNLTGTDWSSLRTS
jgi:hypothetical protein